MKSPEKTAFETILVITVVLAIIMLPLAARADETNMHQPPSFAEFDTDHDGFISEEEFNTFRAERMAARAAEGRPMKGAKTMPDFKDIDTNGDGRLTEAELVAAQQAHREKMRAAHGAHGMGYGHGHDMKMPTFSDLDTNGDGCIDAEEFAAHQAAHHPKD
jgi:hypothetical protein